MEKSVPKERKNECHPDELPKTSPGGRVETTEQSNSRFGKEFVFVDDRSHCNSAFGVARFHAYDFAFASYPDAFGQSNLRRECKGKFDGRPSRNRRVNEETDTAGAYVSRLRVLFPHTIFGVANRNGQPQCKPASCPLILLGLSHESSGQAVSMACCVHRVKAVVWTILISPCPSRLSSRTSVLSSIVIPSKRSLRSEESRRAARSSLPLSAAEGSRSLRRNNRAFGSLPY